MHSQDATIPFKFTFPMLALNKRNQVYTPEYINELQAMTGSERQELYLSN
jgi:hypothetical protein